MYIPTQDNLGYTYLGKQLERIAELAGGYTLEEVKGGWMSPTSGLVHEPVLRLTIMVPEDVFDDEVWLLVRELTRAQLKFGHQEAVLVGRDGKFTLYTADDIDTHI